MSKESKSCKYCGHMRIMDRKNHEKISFEAEKSIHQKNQETKSKNHPQEKSDFPESQKKCTCRHELNK